MTLHTHLPSDPPLPICALPKINPKSTQNQPHLKKQNKTKQNKTTGVVVYEGGRQAPHDLRAGGLGLVVRCAAKAELRGHLVLRRHDRAVPAHLQHGTRALQGPVRVPQADDRRHPPGSDYEERGPDQVQRFGQEDRDLQGQARGAAPEAVPPPPKKKDHEGVPHAPRLPFSG